MDVDTSTLRAACVRLLDHLDSSGLSTIHIEPDYYWDIAEEELYNALNKPGELDMGQLSDDWREIQAIADGTKEPIAYAFTWLAAVMRAVGQKVVR